MTATRWAVLIILMAGCAGPASDGQGHVLLGSWPDLQRPVSAVYDDALYMWGHGRHDGAPAAMRIDASGKASTIPVPEPAGVHVLWEHAEVKGDRIVLHGFIPLDYHDPGPPMRLVQAYFPANGTYSALQSAGPDPTCRSDAARAGESLCTARGPLRFDGRQLLSDAGPLAASPLPAIWSGALAVPCADGILLLSPGTQAVLRVDPVTGSAERATHPLPFHPTFQAMAACLDGNVLVLLPGDPEREPQVWRVDAGPFAPNRPPVARAALARFDESTYVPETDSWWAANATVRDDGSHDPEGGALTLLWHWSPERHVATAGDASTAPLLCEDLSVTLVARDDVGATSSFTLDIPHPGPGFRDAACGPG